MSCELSRSVIAECLGIVCLVAVVCRLSHATNMTVGMDPSIHRTSTCQVAAEKLCVADFLSISI